MAAPQARMAWIRDQVNPGAPDETHIVLGIDCSEQAEAGDRAVSVLLNNAMESDEGVFYLLPHDLSYDVTRSGGTVTVDLLTMDPEWVTVLSATIPFPEDAALPDPPIVVIDHEGVVGLDELLAAISENGMHIVGPRPGAQEA